MAKVVIRIGCATWNSNLKSYLLHMYFRIHTVKGVIFIQKTFSWKTVFTVMFYWVPLFGSTIISTPYEVVSIITISITNPFLFATISVVIMAFSFIVNFITLTVAFPVIITRSTALWIKNRYKHEIKRKDPYMKKKWIKKKIVKSYISKLFTGGPWITPISIKKYHVKRNSVNRGQF